MAFEAQRIETQTRTLVDAEQVRARADELSSAYEGLSGYALLQSMIKHELKGSIALVSSFGAESAVLLHMVAMIDPATPVIFLNTGKLFGETLRYRDKLIDQLGLTNVRSIKPDPEAEAKLDPDGTLWSRDTEACCEFRKVEPMNRALDGFDAWITGRKRFQAASRAAIPLIEPTLSQIKINPLALWGEDDLAQYMAAHDLPPHPLVEDGYLSIGCMPCTDRVAPGQDPRSGRWSGQDKTECGIHTPDTFIDGGGI